MISVLLPPLGLGLLGGVLGTNVAVGALLGLTGTAALIAGAVVNTIAAMILTQIITKASIAIFGDKWGAFIGTLISFVALNVGASFMSGGQLGMNWGSMMRLENIMKLTNAVGNAYSGYAQGEIAELQEMMGEVQTQYEKEMRKLREQSASLGFDQPGVFFDPMQLTDVLQDVDFTERADEFINRTTLTADEMIDLSFSLIYDYVDMNLDLPEF